MKFTDNLQIFGRNLSITRAKYLLVAFFFALVEDRISSFLNSQIDNFFIDKQELLAASLRKVVEYLPTLAFAMIFVAGFFVFKEAIAKTIRQRKALLKYPDGKWTGNQFVLSSPVMQLVTFAVSSMTRQSVTLGCPPNTIARIRYNFLLSENYFYKQDARIVIGRVGYTEKPYLPLGMGRLEVLVNNESKIQYEVQVPDYTKPRVDIDLLGWFDD